jgi:D-sedoheptulose 7-phosphate isomerase
VQRVDDRVAELIQQRVGESVAVQGRLSEPVHVNAVASAATAIAEALGRGGKLLVFGNGGSAADAEHLAGEFVGRYLLERQGLPAIALASHTASVTAIANDYSYDRVFARQVEALGKREDAALAISTSGTSANVLAGVGAAKVVGMTTVGLTGGSGGALAEMVDVCLQVPADETPRIQEAHALLGHILCEIVEAELASRDTR